MSDVVKLTVRLPAALHKRLARRAQDEGRSLNEAMIRSLSDGLVETARMPEAQHDAVARVLAARGLWQPVAASDKSPEPPRSHAELRRSLAGLPALSDVVVADRGPR